MNNKSIIRRLDHNIIDTINQICASENLSALNSLIQEQLLPALEAIVWICYWKENELAALELISVVNSQQYTSKSHNQITPILEFEEQLHTVISSNKHFDCQDKVALLSLLKKEPSNVNEFPHSRYKAIKQAPERIEFVVLGLKDSSTSLPTAAHCDRMEHRNQSLHGVNGNFEHRTTAISDGATGAIDNVQVINQFVEILTPIILLQERNLILKDMIRYYQTMFKEFGEECCIALFDQTYQIIDCTGSFKKLLREDTLSFIELINDILGFENFEKYKTQLRLLDNFKFVYQCGRRSYEVTIQVIELDHSEKQCLGLVRLNRLFNEDSKGLRKLREGRLTQREIEIFTSVYKGNSNAHIANQYCISLYTVKNHLKHIFEKLNVSSRFELATFLD